MQKHMVPLTPKDGAQGSVKRGVWPIEWEYQWRDAHVLS